MEQELIDLTEDGDIKNEPVSELKTDVSEKKRKFPLTIAHTHPPVPVHEHHHQLKQPPRNPYESNMHARDMYYAQHSLEAGRLIFIILYNDHFIAYFSSMQKFDHRFQFTKPKGIYCQS